MSNSNYPEGIREYDNDPCSPFYKDEEEIDDRFEVNEDVEEAVDDE